MAQLTTSLAIMRSNIVIVVFIVVFQNFISMQSAAESDISVMTFNLRLAAIKNVETNEYELADESSGNEWNKRKGYVIDAITSKLPDILALQEMSYAGPEFNDPRVYVRNNLSNHYAVYKGIGGSPKDIFYKSEKLVIDINNSGKDYIWPDSRSKLCPGPDGTGSTRSITWATFFDIKLGNKIFVVNAHLHAGGKDTSVRIKQLECVRKYIKENSLGMAVVLMGDLNSRYSGYEVCSVEKGFTANQLPLFDASGKSSESTFNGFCVECRLDKKLDYIFLRGMEVVGESEIVQYSYYDDIDQKNRWPSDHFPVYAELNFHHDASYVNLENSPCNKNGFSLFW